MRQLTPEEKLAEHYDGLFEFQREKAAVHKKHNKEMVMFWTGIIIILAAVLIFAK